MLFSFFNTRKQNKKIRDHIEKFKGSFTAEQQKAILASLYVIANSDNEFHTTEKDFISHFADAFGISMNQDTFKAFLEMEIETVFHQINSLDEKQKRWYVITLLGMIHADGHVVDEELLFAKRFFNKTGIPINSVKEIIREANFFEK